jgi:hypothetical protein
MRNVLGRARRYDSAEPLTLPQEAEMRRVLALPPAQLERMRLAAAVDRGREDIVLEVTLAIKSRFFEDEANRERYRLDLFALLKAPQEFASLAGGRGGGGSSTNPALSFANAQGGLEQGFMCHSSTPIHTSLSRLPSPAAVSLAVKIFRAILGFMGDRPYSYPTSLAHEVLNVGLACAELRDEVLLQLIKQLSDNPSEASRRRGWALLRVALQTFGPSEEFENYFELWLRRRAIELRPQHARLLHQQQQLQQQQHVVGGGGHTNNNSSSSSTSRSTSISTSNNNSSGGGGSGGGVNGSTALHPSDNVATECIRELHKVVFRGPALTVPSLDALSAMLAIAPTRMDQSRLLVPPDQLSPGEAAEGW